MARVKKELVELLSALSPREQAALQAKLLAPKRAALQREKAKLQKQLKQINRQLAGVKAAKPRRKKARRKVRKARKVKVARKRKARRKVAAVRRPRKGTMASKIQDILKGAPAPMRVKDIVAALVRSGVPRKKGLVNYVNRTLSTNALFTKSGWGRYCLAGRPTAAPAKKAVRKKARRKRAAKRGRPRKKVAARK